MKKIALFIACIMITAASFSQRVTMANYTDTLSGSQTKYYAATVQADLFRGSMGIYVDHLTGSTDSTYVTIQGSIDGSTWIDLGSPTYANTITTTDPSSTTFKVCRFYITDAGMIWTISDPFTLPYYRYKVTHYATGTVRVKGWLYKKK